MEKIKFKPTTNATTESYQRGLKFLFLDSKFQDLHFKSKVLANILHNETDKERKTGSTKFDCDGLPYISLTNTYLAKHLKCSVNSLKKFKSELFDKGILLKPNTNKSRDITFNMDIQIDKKFKYLDLATNEFRFTFFEVADFLFHAEYKHFSLEAIYIFALIRERNKISYQSAQNQCTDYVDKDGFAFCYYSNDELLRDLNLNNRHTIKKHKNMLIASGLLREGHEARRYPDKSIKTVIRFYTFEPINLSKEEPFEIIEVEGIDFPHLSDNVYMNFEGNSQVENKENCQNFPQKLSKNNSETIKNNHQNCQNLTTKESNKEIYKEIYKENSVDELYSELNDVSNTTPIETISNRQQFTNNVSNILDFYNLNEPNNTKEESDIESEQIIKEHKLQHFSKGLAQYLKKYNDKELEILLGILCRSKDEINTAEYTDYRLEDFERTIINTLNKLRQKNRTQQESIFARRKLIKTYVINAMDKQVKSWVEERVNEEFGVKH
ncbi:hypothetical protein [Staphylococcus shinii]|uniref:hypothetical protein n=1 Tax=Staphylococcus shinii TaxID=2912228 RepID=UPI003F546670